MTIWQWMALIAFIFMPFSALNSVLSLRTRYRDRQGIRSKAKFQKRLKELTIETKKIAFYRDHPTTLMLMGQETIFSSGVKFLTAFLLCLVAFALPFLSPLFIAAAFITLSALGEMQVGSKLIHDANVPDDFARHVFAFVVEGKRKGFLPKDDTTMQDLLREHLSVVSRDDLIERKK
jgi:hypothetical protein